MIYIELRGKIDDVSRREAFGPDTPLNVTVTHPWQREASALWLSH
jgi:hypothetical protein